MVTKCEASKRAPLRARHVPQSLVDGTRVKGYGYGQCHGYGYGYGWGLVWLESGLGLGLGPGMHHIRSSMGLQVLGE